tara:strand:+ start:1105 stop:2040 length:936 start_codon:yes stop_codon:yes gene_type:complete
LLKEQEILVTGGTGMVGTALKIIIPDANFIGSKHFDLRDEKEVSKMFTYYEPKYVIHLAAKVGGIKANMDNLGSFYCDNIKINTNVLEQSRIHKVEKLVSLLSTCIYPENVEYPLTEGQIHNGEPHPSNFGYAYAKRMLDVQSRAYRKQYGCKFITVVPNNLFGENDNFDLENSHVIPALIRKIHDAKLKDKNEVVLWGTGAALREFTYSGDIAKILLFMIDKYNGTEPRNIGNTNEYSIKDLANKIANILEYDGKISWDYFKPPGQYKKPSNNKKLLSLGWKTNDYTNFDEALKKTCKWYIINYPQVRGI